MLLFLIVYEACAYRNIIIIIRADRIQIHISADDQCSLLLLIIRDLNQ